jgi:hypothetical protein
MALFGMLSYSVEAGMPEEKASNAANPPAEAPMPTTGKPAAGKSAASRISAALMTISRAAAVCALSLFLVI